MFKEYGMEDELPFGKYKGNQIEDILEDDPQYLVWMYENTDIEFNQEVLNKLEYI